MGYQYIFKASSAFSLSRKRSQGTNTRADQRYRAAEGLLLLGMRLRKATFRQRCCVRSRRVGSLHAGTLQHHNPLIQTPWSADGSRLDIGPVHQCLEEGIREVEFGEDATTGGTLEDIVDNGNRCSIFDCNAVEATKIAEGSEFAIVLFDKESWGRPGRIGWAWAASCTVLFYFSADGFKPD